MSDGPTEPTESALLLEVPAADAVVASWRRRFDPAADLGVPAHLTALFPFIHPRQLDDEVLAGVARVADRTAPHDLVLNRTAWFGTDVLWLAPADPEPCRRLTAELWAAFPDRPPYGGVFEDVVPHLTVGSVRGRVSLSDLRRAERGLVDRLPVRQRIDRLALWTGGTAPGSWRREREFVLGG